MLQTFFWVCFGVGAGFVIISFMLGEVLGFFGDGGVDIDADMDLDVDGGTQINPSGGSPTVSPFKPVIIALFLTMFGGMGLILGIVEFFPWFIVISFSALAGMALAYLVFRFVLVPLHRRQNTSAKSIQSFVGSKAKVVVTIPQGKYGEITYTANGNTFSAPAKSESGDPIPRDSVVEILYIDKGTFFVKQLVNSN
jgi:membrane protein implicated in regulation of membrane protease activity